MANLELIDMTVDKLIFDGRWNVQEIKIFFGYELVCLIYKIPINVEEDELELIQFKPK